MMATLSIRRMAASSARCPEDFPRKPSQDPGDYIRLDAVHN
jgi:hypothetical protein